MRSFTELELRWIRRPNPLLFVSGRTNPARVQDVAPEKSVERLVLLSI